MSTWAKVVMCLQRFVHFDDVGMTRRYGLFQPDHGPTWCGLELLQPRIMLSSTGLRPVEDLSGDAPSDSAVAVTAELNFVPDSGVRLEGGTVPEAGLDPDTGTVYLYYRVGPDEYVTTANDGGLEFSDEWQFLAQPGNEVYDPRCMLMPDLDREGVPVWREFLWDRERGYFTSLVSPEAFPCQPEEGVRYDPPDTDNVGVYTAFNTGDGRVGLMYIGDKGTTTGNVRLAYSDDNGQSFYHYDDNPLNDAGMHDEGMNQRDPDAIVLDDGRIRIFTMVQGGPLAPHPGVRSVTSIHSFLSIDNGLTFTADPEAVLKPDDFTEFDVWSLNDPSVLQLSDGRYRMYVAGLISELPDASDAHWAILSATTTATDSGHGQGTDQPSPESLQLVHMSTYEMGVGTHRPEVLVTKSGQLLTVVVEPEEQDDGRLVKHRVYRFDTNGKPIGEPFAVTWKTDDYGEPADHRAAIIDGELVIVYQSLVFDQGVSPGGGPAEQYALNQSLLLARYTLDGHELFRGPIVAHVTDFDQDNFPDHCLLPLENSLLVSTGTKDQIKFREVSYQGEVLNTHELSTSEIRSLSSIGNSLMRVGDQVWMFAGSGTQREQTSGISVLKLDSKFQPTELAWFAQDGEERTFPTGNLQYQGYTFVTYDVRDTQDRPVGPEDAPFQTRLMVLDEELDLVLDIDIGSGEGFAHVHPTLAILDGDLVIGWSMRAEGMNRRAPQVKLERYSLQFVPDGGVHEGQNLAAGHTLTITDVDEGPMMLGDVDNDGQTNNLDITPFITALQIGGSIDDPSQVDAFLAQVPGGNFASADTSMDRLVNNLDITRWINLLAQSSDVAIDSHQAVSVQPAGPPPAILAAAAVRRVPRPLLATYVHPAGDTGSSGPIASVDIFAEV